MKQKNTKWIVYVILFLILAILAFLSLHNVNPASQRVEKDVSVNIH